MAVSGDGNLVVTGLMQNGKGCSDCLYSCGSTNDFAASLGLSTNIIEAVGDIRETARCRRQDV